MRRTGSAPSSDQAPCPPEKWWGCEGWSGAGGARRASCGFGRGPQALTREAGVAFSTTHRRKALTVFKLREAYSFNFKVDLRVPRAFSRVFVNSREGHFRFQHKLENWREKGEWQFPKAGHLRTRSEFKAVTADAPTPTAARTPAAAGGPAGTPPPRTPSSLPRPFPRDGRAATRGARLTPKHLGRKPTPPPFKGPGGICAETPAPRAPEPPRGASRAPGASPTDLAALRTRWWTRWPGRRRPRWRRSRRWCRW